MKRAWVIGIGLGVFMLVANSVADSYLRLLESLDHHSAGGRV